MDKDRREEIIDALVAEHINQGMAEHYMRRYDDALEAAGAFTDNRPTYEAVEALFQYPYVGNGADVVQRLVDAGLVQPKREEPETIEVRLRERTPEEQQIYRDMRFSELERSVKKLRAEFDCYRKRTEGGRDG